ncbi:hypothetical protein ACSU1N_06685 [Thermogladius sp. 4427co]|uniref:hypothetical protein n=1 Tax=Thermogladius sp. 4427co TaxID=3450718 RepID=UPI003F7B0EE4
MNPKLLKLALTIVETTSIPLFVIGVVYLLTGYDMLTPTRLIPSARLIHTDSVLRILAISLGFLHSYSGFLLLIARRVRSPLASRALLVLVTAIFLTLAALFTALELYSQLTSVSIFKKQ